MHPGMSHRFYTGTAPAPFGAWRGGQPGHCRQCGQPSASCCCGCRECRKEAKELLVVPTTVTRGALEAQTNDASKMRELLTGVALDATDVGSGTGFIGGGCCVTLAVEYAASVATAAFDVTVLVKDSEGTLLGWARSEPAGTPYRVHECIITTRPGATLGVAVANCTARVRWCEVFSCC
jgi:hypothetical protein